jgi:hypothetical protein
MSNEMIRVSRSAIVTRKECEMKRYQQYEMDATGYDVKDFKETQDTISVGSLPKVRGALFHELSLAIVQGAQQTDIRELVDVRSKVFPPSMRKIQSTLIRRAMLGWELIRGVWWRQHFDVESAELAWDWQISDHVIEPLRMDKILKFKSNGHRLIFDFKTISSVDPNWIHRMESSDQTHLYIQALKENTDEWVAGMCYDAVIIGKWDKKKIQQRSPFVLGFQKAGSISAKWSAGSADVDLCDYEDHKWLDWIQKQPGTLDALYATTGTINPPPHILLHTKNSVARAEEEWYNRISLVEMARKQYGPESPQYESLLGLIEKNSGQCYKYGFEYACPFVQQCWRGQPIDPEEFHPRIDHHQETQDA